MARRRKAGVGISLFAFQDIITSVSGILIFVTLLLVLELLGRRPSGGDANAQAAARDLRAAIEETTSRRDALRSRAHQIGEHLRELTAKSPAELRRDAERTEVEAADLDRQVRELEARLEAAQQRVEDAESLDDEAESHRRELQALLEQAEAIEGQVAEESDSDRVYFNVAGGAPRGGWLVEVAGDRIAAAPLDRADRPLEFDRGSREASCRQFLKWLAQGKSVAPYLLLAVRPSGVERFNVIEAELRRAGRAYGFDAVGEGQEIMDPERGVFRP